MRTYVEGNTVRKLQYTQAVPMEQPDYEETYTRKQAPKRREAQGVRRSTASRVKVRNRAVQMNFGYVAFLTGTAVLSLFICVNFLKLQVKSTTLQKEVISLESQYSELKMANDDAYASASSSVNLEEIRDIAINELGMVYAQEGQIVTYDSGDKDYMRQYEDVPQE